MHVGIFGERVPQHDCGCDCIVRLRLVDRGLGRHQRQLDGDAPVAFPVGKMLKP